MATTRTLECAFERDVKELKLQANLEGLRSLFSKILEEVLWARINNATPPTLENILAYCEQKLPDLFGADSATRGAGLAAIEHILDEVYPNISVDEISWPLDPAWLLDRTEDVLEILLEALDLVGVSLPGGTELMARRRENEILRSLLTGKDKYGEEHARTRFFDIPSGSGKMQVGIHRRKDKVYLARRKMGEAKFEIIGDIKTSEVPFFATMLRWLAKAMHAP